MSLVGIHALPLKVIYLCGIVVIKDHSPYSSRQLLGEISRCGIRHRDIYLAFVILHRTFQLSATFKHILRLLTSPRIGVEYSLQTRATIEHSNHIRHRRGVEIREIQKRQTRAIKEHLAHILHRRGVEVGNVEFRQTRTTTEHRAHRCHLRGIEIGKVEFRQTRAIKEHRAHIRHRRGVEIGNVERRQTRAIVKHRAHIPHLRGVEI